MDQKKRNELEEFIVKNQHETEAVKAALKEAEELEKELKEHPPLSLEEVTAQMADGMVHYPDGPIRFALVRFFDGRLSMPIPFDYLNRHTTEENLVILVNDAMGISLTMQLAKAEKESLTLEEVKNNMKAQLSAAGIYIEILEEGEVEDYNAPTCFLTYRMPIDQGVMFHLMFYIVHKGDKSMVIGDYNCFYKDIAKWENIIKATVSYMDFQ